MVRGLEMKGVEKAALWEGRTGVSLKGSGGRVVITSRRSKRQLRRRGRGIVSFFKILCASEQQ
jgi:hypothetical protein